MGKTGPKPHEPTPESRARAEELSGLGLPQDMIARRMGIAEMTLKNYYAEELKNGSAKATEAVAATLFQKAIGGDITALIFWMKVRAGWSEKNVVEHNHSHVHKIEREIVEAPKPVIDITPTRSLQ